MAKRIRQIGVLVVSAAFVAAIVATPALAINLGDLAGKAKDAAKRDQPAKSDDPKAANSQDCPPETKPITFTGPKKRLAVMDMEIKVTTTQGVEPTATGGTMTTTTTAYIPPPSDFGTGLTEMLTTSLIDTGRFILLERKAFADLQNEYNLSATPMVNQATAIGQGKLLAAQTMIRGAVTEYTYKKSSTGGNASILNGVDLAASKAEASVALDIRIYDAATGQILDSVRAEGRAKSSATAVGINQPGWKMSAAGFSQSPLGAATRQAIERGVKFICERMEKVPWEGRVAEMDRDAGGAISGIYINAGSRTGLKENDKLEILRPGRNIVDPETQVVIGRTKDTKLGMCEIAIIKDNLAIASLTEGNDCQVGDIVRFVDPNAKPGSVLLPGDSPTPAPPTTDAATGANSSTATTQETH